MNAPWNLQKERHRWLKVEGQAESRLAMTRLQVHLHPVGLFGYFAATLAQPTLRWKLSGTPVTLRKSRNDGPVGTLLLRWMIYYVYSVIAATLTRQVRRDSVYEVQKDCSYIADLHLDVEKLRSKIRGQKQGAVRTLDVRVLQWNVQYAYIHADVFGRCSMLRSKSIENHQSYDSQYTASTKSDSEHDITYASNEQIWGRPCTIHG